ncbi:hypothetical protein F8M49_30115 [Rhodococcus zopfii]|uniref:Uncharacterized protein n=1 Tax=Rhodococcus zopfii TaxID=43772 RepID=A0ABU3WX80_9NOCA|nr:hypothetical protein [Rhodococcus zopfii]
MRSPIPRASLDPRFDADHTPGRLGPLRLGRVERIGAAERLSRLALTTRASAVGEAFRVGDALAAQGLQLAFSVSGLLGGRGLPAAGVGRGLGGAVEVGLRLGELALIDLDVDLVIDRVALESRREPA